MSTEIIELVTEVAQSFAQDEENASGELNESNVQVKLGDFEEGDGLTFSSEILLDGPELAKEQDTAMSIFPDKTADDLMGYVALKVKGDAEAACEEFKTLLEAMGLPLEDAEQFAQLEFKAGEGEILIGFAPSSEEIIAPIAPLLMNPTFLKGDGSEDLKMGMSVNFATNLTEACDDEPFYSHLLKGFSMKFYGKAYDKSREIFQRILVSQWDKLKPWADKIPILGPILLFKKLNGSIDYECDDELKEEINEFVQEVAPPLAMSVSDAISFGKNSGMVPVEMIEPVIDFFKTHFDGEMRVFTNRSVGFKMTWKLPGLDDLLQVFEDA